ncbi:hypothetical protein J7355_15640 [Endozoicomonas sp. G2_2]|uniref:hypothetical protein n=1 Tax=Endozoicomonas sp. G2_2 TaxID=2821092 RepID=UPI001ADC1E24|nr:hypothetical protein [Endozoicomonas sp. G2_2]MBO9471522.1 hypothetical protein [Endozoicomonas sp. G2_2]
MTQPSTDLEFRTPAWPVAYTLYASNYWRVVLAAINDRGVTELRLYEPSSHAPLGRRPMRADATETQLDNARSVLMGIQPRTGEGVLPASAWVRCPIKPMLELSQAQRSRHFYAQFFSVDEESNLCIRTFRGDGESAISTESHKIAGDPTEELWLGDSTRQPDPNAPRELIGLQNGTASQRTQVCPQMVEHDLSRLMPAGFGGMGVSTRVRGSGLLAF